MGWSIFGYEDSTKTGVEKHVAHAEVSRMMEDWWTTDSFGTLGNAKKPMSIKDGEMLAQMERTSTVVNGKIKVDMLWNDKFKSASLPNSYLMAEKCFASIRNKLRKNPKTHERYAANLREYIVKGYARKMLPAEVEKIGPKTWYLPHHPVFHPNKPDKVRVVMNAAAKTEDISLNDQLAAGPDLLNNLVGILIRFRNFLVAIVAESMFHQVLVHELDKDALRFLWTDDIFSMLQPDVYQMLVHVFGARDSPCCAAFALRKTAHDNRYSLSAKAVETVLRDFYVDDLLKSMDTEEEARCLIQEVKEMLARSGFNLTKFVSNSKAVLSGLSERDLGKCKQAMGLEHGPMERTLGILWDIVDDKFTFSFNQPGRKILETKRGVLTIISSIFDPLGFLIPFLIRMKILLQNLWRRKCGWDECLKQHEIDLWREWIEELHDIESFKIRRCYTKMPESEVERRELHAFADASELAFGAVAYLRVLYRNGDITNTFVLSKSRLAPIKPLTIPRLELQAVVLGTRLKNTIIEEIDTHIHQVCFWTDSMHVLQYINNEERRFKVFVSNRVAEIQQNSDVEQWRHIPGQDNRADDITRGMRICDLCEESRCVAGPQILLDKESHWLPTDHIPPIADGDTEVKVAASTVEVSCALLLEQLKRFISWQKILSITGWV